MSDVIDRLNDPRQGARDLARIYLIGYNKI